MLHGVSYLSDYTPHYMELISLSTPHLPTLWLRLNSRGAAIHRIVQRDVDG